MDASDGVGLATLPHELLLRILSFVRVSAWSLLQVRRTCTSLAAVALDPTLWQRLDASYIPGENVGLACHIRRDDIGHLPHTAVIGLARDTALAAHAQGTRGIAQCRLLFAGTLSPSKQEALLSSLRDFQAPWLTRLRIAGIKDFRAGAVVDAFSAPWPQLARLSLEVRIPPGTDGFGKPSPADAGEIRDLKRALRRIAGSCRALVRLDLAVYTQAHELPPGIISRASCPAPFAARELVLRGSTGLRIRFSAAELQAVFPSLRRLSILEPWCFHPGHEVEAEADRLWRALHELRTVEDLDYAVANEKSVEGFLPIFAHFFHARPPPRPGPRRLRISRCVGEEDRKWLPQQLDQLWADHARAVAEAGPGCRMMERLAIMDDGDMFEWVSTGPGHLEMMDWTAADEAEDGWDPFAQEL